MTDSDVVIRVEGLGKKYSIHHEKSERYTALRDVVARQAKAAGQLLINPFTLAGQLRKAKHEAAVERAESEEEFWALKNVSFEIRRGERVGIIGRNGAGKSTLLKILSRITEPTTGRVEIRGRVASLLEVGTGFHPELTGRENIYLNGAILGMTRREIRLKFDEIVDFAEVEKFLDTPVKRYSSGMYVRLAFAVAAHLEPEILVVDEVLAVGDASFQKKCISKMDESSSKEEKTIIFVSHQLQIVQRLCTRAIVLGGGSCIFDGDTSRAVIKYNSELELAQDSHRQVQSDISRALQILSFSAASAKRDGTATTGEDAVITLNYRVCKDIAEACWTIGIDDPMGQRVAAIKVKTSNKESSLNTTYILSIKLKNTPLVPGIYAATLFVSSSYEILAWHKCEYSIKIDYPNKLNGLNPISPPDEGCLYLDITYLEDKC